MIATFILYVCNKWTIARRIFAPRMFSHWTIFPPGKIASLVNSPFAFLKFRFRVYGLKEWKRDFSSFTWNNVSQWRINIRNILGTKTMLPSHIRRWRYYAQTVAVPQPLSVHSVTVDRHTLLRINHCVKCLLVQFNKCTCCHTIACAYRFKSYILSLSVGGPYY